MREPQSELKGFVAGAVWVVCTALVPGVVDAQGPAGGVVEGVVIARETRQVIPNAKVSIDSLSATANTGGRFRLTGVPPGNAIVVATAPGYLDLRIEAVQVRADQPTTLSVEMEATPNYLERVQVTASKTPLSIGEVAAQTDVINRDTLETRGDQTLTDALTHVPGAVVSTQLGIFDSVMLRGMPRGDPEFTNVLVLVDGVPQTLSNNASRIIALPINQAASKSYADRTPHSTEGLRSAAL
jgi:outer membrane receptor protein involved in Fe transport